VRWPSAPALDELRHGQAGRLSRVSEQSPACANEIAKAGEVTILAAPVGEIEMRKYGAVEKARDHPGAAREMLRYFRMNSP